MNKNLNLIFAFAILLSIANVATAGFMFPIPGCTDPIASNYDPMANFDDGTCVYTVYGCTDPIASNYNPLANTEDGSCIYPIYGCTDVSAINYNLSANTEDGSCVFPPTAVEQCKKYGWEVFGIFVNQGDCVSFVVTNGTNEPAGI